MTEAYKGSRDYLDLGNWNLACSMCGRKRKASEVVKNWQGQWRCPEHNELRQPQDFVRAVPDIQTPPFMQPEVDTFAGVCFPFDQTAIADYAVADCAICDYVSPFTGLPTNSPTVYIFLTGSGTWLVPDDWNPLNNKIECLGKGGNGSDATHLDKSSGGGGGGYSSISNINPVVGSLISYGVDTDGSWFNGSSLAACAVGAANGQDADGSGGPGMGGQEFDGTGIVKFSGGNGGSGAFHVPRNGGGGGGAGGPLGDGIDGSSGGGTLLGTGGKGGGSNGVGLNGGLGGSIPTPNGSNGVSDKAFDATHGTGGGGGGGGSFGLGGNGADYGGGGGGGLNAASSGGAGVIVISYQPI